MFILLLLLAAQIANVVTIW